MPSARDLWRRVGGLTASVLVAALALVPGLELWRFATSSSALPQWDMAAHGVAGLRLADAVRQLDPLGWLLEIHGMSTWPPAWPLVESAAFLVVGGQVSVVRGLVAICWMLSVVAAFWALRAMAPGPGGDALGLLAAAWLAQAPLLQALSTVILLEVPGIFGLMVCLGCALRALDPEAGLERRDRWWRATWLTALALFFLKYNYGLLWWVPLILSELVRRRGDERYGGWRALAAWGWRRIRSIRWTPWTIFVAVYLVLLASIWLSGGIDTEILGQRLRVTSVGNPAYALLLLACLRVLLGGRPAWNRLRRHWRRLDASWHGLASLLIAPIFLWMLLPPHVKEFFGFVENRSSDLGRVEALAFYPRVVMEQVSVSPWFGVATLLLALSGLSWLASRDARHRLLALTTLFAWLALLAHPYKLPRFAVQAAVLTGCLAAAWLVATGLGRWRSLRALALPVGVVAAAGALWLGVDRPFVETQHRLRTVPARSAPVADEAARVAREGGVVLGTWNELSPGLVEWRARRDPAVGAGLDAGWRPTTTFDLTRRRDAVAVVRELDSTPCRSVAVVHPQDPDATVRWASENAWMDDVIEALRTDPCRRPASVQQNLTVFACPQGNDTGTGRRP